MTINQIQTIVGVVLIVIAAVYGLIRILAVPMGLNFTAAAIFRYIIFTIIAAGGGIALIAFAQMQ